MFPSPADDLSLVLELTSLTERDLVVLVARALIAVGVPKELTISTSYMDRPTDDHSNSLSAGAARGPVREKPIPTALACRCEESRT